MCVCVLISVQLCDPTDCSQPGSSVHGIPRQEYWSGLPFPTPGDLFNAGIEPESPALAGGFFTTEPSREPLFVIMLSFSEFLFIFSFREFFILFDLILLFEHVAL